MEVSRSSEGFFRFIDEIIGRSTWISAPWETYKQKDLICVAEDLYVFISQST